MFMSSRRSQQQEDTKFRVMQLLDENPQISQREMAKALGISFGAINYCLNALIDKGQVKIQNFSQNQNKFGYSYLLTPSGLSEKTKLTSSFLKRKIIEYKNLKAEIDALKLELQDKDANGLLF
jgi:EPS-associated MarR family transcriptional regulator